MNMRSYNDKHCRAISLSADGGESWLPIAHNFQLVESKCQASILNYGSFIGKHMHLFTNPAVPEGRTHLTLKASLDDCKSWGNSKLVYQARLPIPASPNCPTGKSVFSLKEERKMPMKNSYCFRFCRMKYSWQGLY